MWTVCLGAHDTKNSILEYIRHTTTSPVPHLPVDSQINCWNNIVWAAGNQSACGTGAEDFLLVRSQCTIHLFSYCYFMLKYNLHNVALISSATDCLLSKCCMTTEHSSAQCVQGELCVVPSEFISVSSTHFAAFDKSLKVEYRPEAVRTVKC